jgi:prepilin-type N-terminal cleavage/methylation domain-containing protein
MPSSHLSFWLHYCYRLQNDKRNSSGFTLIEILIVVIVAGILTALAFPAYQGWIDKTRYAHARVQMNCTAKELQGFKLENGFFPPDVARNTRPAGIQCFYLSSSGEIPFDSVYDYENWTATGGRYIQITFLGKNRTKEFPNNNPLFLVPGIYEYEDDLVLSLGVN